jgi:hypothetical protein
VTEQFWNTATTDEQQKRDELQRLQSQEVERYKHYAELAAIYEKAETEAEQKATLEAEAAATGVQPQRVVEIKEEAMKNPVKGTELGHQGGPLRTKRNVGEYTGAARPPYPEVFRRFGWNPRETIIKSEGGRRPTGMHTDGYDASIVRSKPQPTLLNPKQTRMVQDGTDNIHEYIPALRRGAAHVLWQTHGS